MFSVQSFLEQLQADLVAAAPFIPQHGSGPSCAAIELLTGISSSIVTYRLQPLYLLNSDDWRLRLTGLLALADRLETDGELCRRCIEVALHDRDPCVRGAAWVVIVQAWRSREPQMLADALGDVLASQRGVLETMSPPMTRTTARGVLTLLKARLTIVSAFQTIAFRSLRQEGIDPDFLDAATDSVDRLLSHPTGCVRHAALLLLHHASAHTDLPYDKWRELCALDSEPDVRKMAISVAKERFKNTSDKDVMGILATIVSDSAQSLDFRVKCYLAMLAVDGRSHRDLPRRDARAIAGTLADVDWAYVERWL